MKKIFLVIVFLVAVYAVFAQSVGIGTATPNSKAILDLQSTGKGFLLPRMTEAQRLAIPSSVPTGLMVYQTDKESGIYVNLNFLFTNWVRLSYDKSRLDTLIIGHESFLPGFSSHNYFHHPWNVRYMDGTTAAHRLMCNIPLPSGTLIKRITFFYLDQSTTSDLVFEIDRGLLNQGSISSEATISSSSASDLIRSITLLGDREIKGSEFYFRVIVRTTNGWQGNQLGLKAMRIIYEPRQ